MISKLTRNAALSLGLAGSLAIAAAPAAEAQVQVTGGLLSGDAAFFEPTTAADGISLFDINIRNLTLISPNGVLSNPLFVPTATGGYVDTNSDGRVTSGDTGLLQGRLSGVGFDSNGFPIPFSQVGTVLQYNVGSFNSDLSLSGSRVTADGIPQLFIPGSNLTITGSGITANQGRMQIGELNANVTDGLIALPSNIRFQGGPSLSPVLPSVSALSQKIKFEFKGDNVDGSNPENDLIGADGSIRLIADTTDYKIETVGGGSLKLKVEGNIGTLDFAVADGVTVGNTTINGAFVPGDPLDYEIKGQARGVLTLFNSSPLGVGFAGSNRTGDQPTEYKFEQDNGFRSSGRLRGDVNFLLAAGQRDFDFDGNFASYRVPDLNNNIFIQTRNIRTPVIDINNILVDSYRLSFRDRKLNFGTVNFNINVDSDPREIRLARRLFLSFLDDVKFSARLNGPVSNIFVLADNSDFANLKFSFYARPLFLARVSPSGRVRVRLVQVGGNQILVASRPGRGRALGALKMRGPSSRLFPGLVGLYQLSDEQVEAINEELALTDEVEDDLDLGDETDLDDDADEDDLDDIELGDDDDDDDAEESAPEVNIEAPGAIEGLPLDDTLGDQL